MSNLSSKIITWSFFVLLAFTPLFYSAQNSELFEFNKMRLVYGLTVVITTAWLVKMIQLRQFIFKRTPLDIPIVLFLASQIISTILSIDMHTSIWGYYSRSNGGLLSILSYIILFYAFVSNYKGFEVIKFVKAAILGGLLVSIYAIPEHFGVSPSCVWLTSTFSADCWIQDVQARVFASMGQPNWLAAYLGMIIFPTAFFFVIAKSDHFKQKVFYGISTLLMYMAFTFTYSRGGMLGFGAGLIIFVLLILYLNRHPRPDRGSVRKASRTDSRLRGNDEVLLRKKQSLSLRDDEKNTGIAIGQITYRRSLYLLVGGIIVVNLLFGSALTGAFRLIRQNAPPPRPGITGQAVPSGTQLENGGTESGQIRLIVWKGALDIFRHYPIFGSGVETFAYAYYQYRPIEHNYVSEWDFLYNKAHNEYLNYLATTGIVGFVSYLLMIGAFLFWSLRFLLGKVNSNTTFEQKLLVLSLAAGYVSYLVQNIFSFSVVMIALLFFIFPALAITFGQDLANLESRLLRAIFSPLIEFLYSREIYAKLAVLFVVFLGVIYTFKVYQNWEADTFYKQANDLVDSGYVGEGYNTFITANDLNPSEPLYLSELGFAAAAASVSHKEVDATEAARIKDVAVYQTEKALAQSPKNTSLWRTAIRTYYQLAGFDPIYVEKTLETIDQTIRLAPTDPKLYFNKGLILESENRHEEAIAALEKAIEMRPNYRDALVTLGQFYLEQKKPDQAVTAANKVLKLVPNDPDAEKILLQATASAKTH